MHLLFLFVREPVDLVQPAPFYCSGQKQPKAVGVALTLCIFKSRQFRIDSLLDGLVQLLGGFLVNKIVQFATALGLLLCCL